MMFGSTAEPRAMPRRSSAAARRTASGRRRRRRCSSSSAWRRADGATRRLPVRDIELRSLARARSWASPAIDGNGQKQLAEVLAGQRAATRVRSDWRASDITARRRRRARGSRACATSPTTGSARAPSAPSRLRPTSCSSRSATRPSGGTARAAGTAIARPCRASSIRRHDIRTPSGANADRPAVRRQHPEGAAGPRARPRERQRRRSSTSRPTVSTCKHRARPRAHPRRRATPGVGDAPDLDRSRRAAGALRPHRASCAKGRLRRHRRERRRRGTRRIGRLMTGAAAA